MNNVDKQCVTKTIGRAPRLLRHREKRILNNLIRSGLRNILLAFIMLIPSHSLIHAGENTTNFAKDIKGKFNISNYYLRDSENYDFHILTSRINLYKHEEEKPGLFFEFDTKVRKKIINGDTGANSPEYKFDELWLGYKFPEQKYTFVAGRQYINEMYNTYVDGLNLKYSFKKDMGLGIFGGLAPDKTDNSFNMKFKSMGMYGFIYNDKHRISLGYERLIFEGRTDREYFSLRAFSRIKNNILINAISSAAINQLTNNVEVENANISLINSQSKKLRFNLFFTYYRTIKYYESSKYYYELTNLDDSFLLDNNSQTRGGIRVDYKPLKGLKVYASTAYQTRKTDNENSIRITGGIRKYDLYGFDFSGRYTYIGNVASRSNEFNVEVNRYIFNKVDVSIYASHEEEKLDVENAFTSGALTYGTSLYWPINKHFYALMFAERLDEDDYKNNSMFTQIGFKF